MRAKNKRITFVADQNAKIAVYGIHVMANRWGLRIDFEAIMRRADAEGGVNRWFFAG